MGVISGIDMAIDGESTGRRFQISHKTLHVPYTASNLSGGMGRMTAVKDFRGWYLGYLPNSGNQPANFPGDTFTFTGTMDQTNNYGATGDAIVDALVIRGSYNRGGPIEYMVRFSGNGALTLGSATASDATNPNPATSLDMKIAVDGADEDDCRDIVMEITAKNRPYISSSTSGIVKRTPGVVDARVMWQRYENNPANITAVNTNGVIRVYVTSTLYWQITNMFVTANDDFTADRDGEENVGVQMMAHMNGAAAGAGIGTIINPNSVTKWP